MNPDFDSKQWANAWRIIKEARPDILTHEEQCKNIVSAFKFDVFLDLGPGRAGTEAWSISRMLPDCVIYGLEPQTIRYRLLKEHRYPGLLYNTAVASTTGAMSGFMGFEGGKSDFWLKAEDKYVEGGAYKRCIIGHITIDYIIETNDFSNVFIWADIEGAELEMLKGARRSLEAGKITGLNIELNYNDIFFHCTHKEVIDFLREYGFVPGAITGGDCLFGKSGKTSGTIQIIP